MHLLNNLLTSPLPILLLILTLVIFPIRRILQRMGLSGWWCLLVFISLGNLFALWVLAFVRWPTVDKQQTGASLQGLEQPAKSTLE
jgi:uncharacterized SAM-binding protein YcdF (DUF218 family)